jgi:hypothetical protein
MNQPPDDGAERSQPEGDDRQRLYSKSRAALFDGPGIAEHVEDSADDPHRAQRGCATVADIDRKQPQRRQEQRQLFEMFICARNTRSKSVLPEIAGSLTPNLMRALDTRMQENM